MQYGELAGPEDVARLATVLECEPAELLKALRLEMSSAKVVGSEPANSLPKERSILDVGADAALTTSMVNNHNKGAKRRAVQMAIDSVPPDTQSRRADRLTQSHRSSPGGAIALPPLVSLMVIALSSLGLWAAIGWAVKSLGFAGLW